MSWMGSRMELAVGSRRVPIACRPSPVVRRPRLASRSSRTGRDVGGEELLVAWPDGGPAAEPEEEEGANGLKRGGGGSRARQGEIWGSAARRCAQPRDSGCPISPAKVGGRTRLMQRAAERWRVGEGDESGSEGGSVPTAAPTVSFSAGERRRL
ncbi:hypothetical protein GQ53DRAFT_153327 [Thozetella sp. PMI_491]|nr:hypothetical protein GQ53DRAFT_153327 [Thozetella sp. PMI_491]